MAGHAQLKFVMTECSKTHIRLTELMYSQFKQSERRNATFDGSDHSSKRPVLNLLYGMRKTYQSGLEN